MLILHQQRGGATAAVPWKEEGEVPAWSDGVGGTETGVDHNNIVGGASGRMKRALQKPPADNSNCTNLKKI